MLYALLLIAVLAMILRYLAMKWMRTASVQAASRQQRRAHLNYFSFRPPPASISSY
jgi:protein-S-isoprenylcysteine O-methyltransferase Ste14